MSFVRWVMVRKRQPNKSSFEPAVPKLKEFVASADLVIPSNLNFSSYNTVLSGSSYIYDDYKIGEFIDHTDGVTMTDAEHMMATRLWQRRMSKLTTQQRPKPTPKQRRRPKPRKQLRLWPRTRALPPPLPTPAAASARGRGRGAGRRLLPRGRRRLGAGVGRRGVR